MDRGKLQIILEIFLLIMVFITLIVFVAFIYTVKTEGGACVLNPAQYYAEKNNINNICESCRYEGIGSENFGKKYNISLKP